MLGDAPRGNRPSKRLKLLHDKNGLSGNKVSLSRLLPPFTVSRAEQCAARIRTCRKEKKGSPCARICCAHEEGAFGPRFPNCRYRSLV